jgi:small subunit ribosomal protein S16
MAESSATRIEENSTTVAVKIKLARYGKIREPYYRVVVADARTRRSGRAIETIGRYNPKADPSIIEIESERAQYWLGVGAQPTEAVVALLSVTGDWQTFKGLPGSDGTLKLQPEKVDKRALYDAAVAAAGGRTEDASGATTARRKGAPKKTEAATTAPAEAASTTTASTTSAPADVPPAEAAPTTTAPTTTATADVPPAEAAPTTTATADVPPAEAAPTTTAPTTTATADVPPAEADAATPVVAGPSSATPADTEVTEPSQGAADERASDSDERSETADNDAAPFGEGSHAPLDGDAQPAGFSIKGNASSKLYHRPGTPFYDSTIAEVWFASAEAAEAAGFALPKSQQDGEDVAPGSEK